jgi:ribosomal peptide maturation radical SAM protein 1
MNRKAGIKPVSLKAAYLQYIIDMKNRSTRPLDKIALISTPWPLYSRPSIQLGTLKAFLHARIPDLKIDAFHFYLSIAEAIGYRLYHEIAERSWLAESVFAALFYPERIKKAEALFRKEAPAEAKLQKINFTTLTRRVKTATDALIRSQNWQTYGLLGFTISLCQLTSALYVIRRIKKKFPNLMIVVGGALTPGIAAPGILKSFPEVDVVVNGEGEIPLYHIIDHLRRTPPDSDFSKVQGVFTRCNDMQRPHWASFSQLNTLDELRAPDYDDYFELLKTFDAGKSFFPTLPVEISRGCWWKRAVGSAKVTGCAFCNLNLQWDGYRSKPASQVASEIVYLTDRYQTLSVAIMDNVLPKKEAIDMFRQILGLGRDLRLFGEVRATTPWRELKAMGDCGMREVQIGIEAFSSSLLKKLHKGTSAIQNLEIMKNCEALGIRNISNLILHFPGSNQQDVAETLRTLEFALPFHPLKAVSFWLGLESPVWQQPKKFGIQAVFNHPNYAFLFPEKIRRGLPLMIQAYRGDLTYQKKIWRPVKKKISDWQKQYAEIQNGPGDSPILSFRDGRNFMIIHQKRFRAEPAVHRLVGASREIYLFCQQHRSIQTIFSAFYNISDDSIAKFLNMMVDKKLMFAEKNRYLSLASAVK